MTKARELAELSRTIIDTSDATAITINADEEVTFADDLFLADGKKAVFGAGSDFQIFHDGNNSFMNNTSGDAGALSIKSHDINLMSSASETMATFVEDGAVSLYHNNGVRLATSASGVDVTGTLTATGVLTVIDGSTSAPSISNAGDSNSGIYFPADDELGFLVGGSRKIHITSSGVDIENGSLTGSAATFSGNVAISNSSGDTLTLTKSTTEPSLRIEGDSGKDFVMTVSGELLTFTQNDGATDILTLDHDSKAATFSGSVTSAALTVTTSTYNKINSYFSGSYISGFKFSDLNGGIWYDAGTDDLTVSAAHANSKLILVSGGSTALTLLSDQSATFSSNVGVGKSAGAVRIDVETDLNGNLAGQFKNTHATGSYGIKVMGGHDSSNYSAVFTDKDNATLMMIRGDGSVGIGTQNVDELLHIEKSAGTTIVKTEVAANSIVGFEIKKTNATTSNWRIVDGQTVNGKLEIYDVTNSRGVMTFDQNGNTGIGTASPVNNGTNSHGLTINGTGNYQNIALQVNGTSQFLIYTNGYNGTFIDQITDDPMMFLTNDTERLRINTDGSVQLLHTTAGNITGGASRAGAVLKLHHEAQWENGYTGGDFLGGIEFSTGDSSAGEGVRAAIKTSVDSYYNTNKMRFYVAQNANTSLLERLELEDNLIFKGRAGTSPRFELVNFDNEDNDTGRETTLRFNGHRSGGEQIVNAQISGHHSGNADDDQGMMIFWTNTGSGGLVETLRIRSDKSVSLNDGHLIMSNGYGVHFGAAAGSGASSTVLDDYEEGTWTPVIVGMTATGSFSPGAANGGFYVKIGRKVTAWMNANGTLSGASGIMNVTGLPFPVATSTTANGKNALYSTGSLQYWHGAGADVMGPLMTPGATQIYFHTYNGTSNGSQPSVSNQAHNLHCFVTYYTD